MLEDEGQGCGVKERCILSEKLGLAELCWLKRRWLSLWGFDFQAWEDVVNGRIGATGWAKRKSAGGWSWWHIGQLFGYLRKHIS